MTQATESDKFSVVLWGDSQVANTYPEHKDHTDAWRLLLGSGGGTMYNVSRGGYNSDALVDFMKKALSDMANKIHLHSIMIGGNDAISKGVPPYQHVSIERFRENLFTMVDKICSKAEEDDTPTRINFVTPIPIHFKGISRLRDNGWCHKEGPAGKIRPDSSGKTSRSGMANHIRRAASNATTASYAQVVVDVVEQLNDEIKSDKRRSLLSATVTQAWDAFAEKFRDSADLDKIYMDGLHWGDDGQDIFVDLIRKQGIPGLTTESSTPSVLPRKRVIDLGEKLPPFSTYLDSKEKSCLDSTYGRDTETKGSWLRYEVMPVLGMIGSQALWAAKKSVESASSYDDEPQTLAEYSAVSQAVITS